MSTSTSSSAVDSSSFAHFQGVTGCEDGDETRHYLLAHGGDVDLAVQAFFADRDGIDDSRGAADLQRRVRQRVSAPSDSTTSSGDTHHTAAASPSLMDALKSWFAASPPSRATRGADFLLQFEEEYGTQHVPFFDGAFAGALAAAREQGRPLLLYLHAEHHELTDAFCRQVLCAPSVAEFCVANCLCYASPLTSPEGYRISNMLCVTQYPFCALACEARGGGSRQRTLRVLDVLALGAVPSAEQALAVLQRAHGAWRREQLQQAGGARRAQRATSEAQRLRDEQEARYRASLDADRRRAEEAAAAEQAALAEERAAADAEQALAARLEHARRVLRDEPPAGADNIATLAIRVPSGARLVRRFRTGEPLDAVYAAVDLHLAAEADSDAATRELIDNYQLVTNFPPATFADRQQTIGDAGLAPQAALFVSPQT